MAGNTTTADAIAATLAAYGVRRVFGIPGGGSSLELIEACGARGIAYMLTHTEAAAAIMASVTGELGDAPGVVATALGPGAASAANGVAYAALDRAPLLVVTDAYQAGSHDFITHQRFDHAALFAPLVKASARAAPGDAARTLAALLDAALAPPRGPVHLDLSAVDAAAPAAPTEVSPAAREATVEGNLDAALRLVAGARRPALVAGMQARTAPDALAGLADRLACPVLTTYKAKGVYPDGAERHAGLFTGARSEARWLANCDLLVLFGVDPVELVASPWPYEMPVLELAEAEIRPHYADVAAAVYGPLPALADAVSEAARPANWPVPRPLVLPEAGDGLTPHAAVRAAIAAAPAGTRLTIDAGAHMLPAMALWPAKAPFDVQISNGLSTMGFALPAAIATALASDARVLALTGDGGLAMCLGELATAARERAPVTVLVFNDGALSMIDLKQQQRGFECRGVRTPALDFARIAEGAGCRAARADDEAALAAALAEAFSSDGPMLIDARIDPSGYRAMFEAIRGAAGAVADT